MVRKGKERALTEHLLHARRGHAAFLESSQQPDEGSEGHRPGGEAGHLPLRHTSQLLPQGSEEEAVCGTVRTRGQEKDGEFMGYQARYNLANNRIKLSFKGLSNVKVTLLDNNQNEEFVAYSDALGYAYLFNSEERDNYTVKVEYTIEVTNNSPFTCTQLELVNYLPDRLFWKVDWKPPF